MKCREPPLDSSPSRSARCLLFVLRHPRLYHFFHQRCRQRLVRRKLQRALGRMKSRQFALELLNHRPAHREKTAMIRKRRECHQRPVIPEHRNPVPDGLGSLRWRRCPNRRPNLLQSTARRLRNAGKVLVYVLGRRTTLRARPASATCRFFHRSNLWGIPLSSCALKLPRAPLDLNDCCSRASAVQWPQGNLYGVRRSGAAFADDAWPSCNRLRELYAVRQPRGRRAESLLAI